MSLDKFFGASTNVASAPALIKAAARSSASLNPLMPRAFRAMIFLSVFTRLSMAAFILFVISIVGTMALTEKCPHFWGKSDLQS